MPLPKQTSGPLQGFASLDVDFDKFNLYVEKAIDMGIDYEMGAKDPRPGTFPPDYDAIDCSGFVRTVLDYCTNKQTINLGIPDGSYIEDGWFQQEGFKKTDYSNAGLSDDRLRVAVHLPNGRGGDSTGHIWLIRNGQTSESYGGNGPGHRDWNHQWFLDHVDHCYVIA